MTEEKQRQILTLNESDTPKTRFYKEYTSWFLEKQELGVKITDKLVQGAQLTSSSLTITFKPFIMQNYGMNVLHNLSKNRVGTLTIVCKQGGRIDLEKLAAAMKDAEFDIKYESGKMSTTHRDHSILIKRKVAELQDEKGFSAQTDRVEKVYSQSLAFLEWFEKNMNQFIITT